MRTYPGNIVRFRCYFCGCRAWEPLENFKLEGSAQNTLITLCDPCEENWNNMTPHLRKELMESKI